MNLDAIALTDHFWPSIGSRRGGAGLIEERRREINELRAAYPNLRILDGAEVDLYTDGSHAPVSGGLDQFDIIIGSFHLRCDSTQWAHGIESVLNNLHFDILGHWDGYLSYYRQEDGERVAQLLAEKNVAIEISHRYPTEHIRFLEAARDAGCKFTLGSDAHHVSSVGDLSVELSEAKALGLTLLDIA